MRRIVITGGSGVLGSHLVPLLRDEAELHLLGGRAPGIPNVGHHPHDLGVGLEGAALPPAADAVIHLAQSRRFRDFPASSDHVARVNVQATVELAQYAARVGVGTFIHVSTGGVYAPGPDPLPEWAPVAEASALSFYAATKLAAERLLAPFSSFFSLIVLRPFFIYGRGQDHSMLIPRLIDCVRLGKPVRLRGADGMRINPIHASDAASAVRAALGLEGSHCLNLAGAETLTMRQIAEAIGRATGVAPVLAVDEASGDGDLIGGIDAMRRLLGPPSVPFERGVRDLL